MYVLFIVMFDIVCFKISSKYINSAFRVFDFVCATFLS